MSVDDTVRWAKERSLKDRPVSDPPPQLNAAARETLYDILADSQQRPSWRPVVYAFRYLGQAEDVPRLTKWIEGFKGESFDSSSIDIVLQAQQALGIMNRRGVDGARAQCDKMMSPDYWRDLNIRIAGDYNPVKDIGGSEYYLAMHGAVANIYSLDPDLKKKIQKITERIADSKTRREFQHETADILTDYDAHMADGLFASQRLGQNLAEARARLEAQKEPKAPTDGAYFRAYDNGVIGDVKLDVAVKDRLLSDARKAFADIVADFDKDDREAVLRRMCDHQKPCVLQDVEGADRVAEWMSKPETSVLLDLEKPLAKDALAMRYDESEALIQFCVFDYQNKGKIDASKVAAEPEKNVDLIYVWIPILDSAELRAKHPLMLDRDLLMTGRAKNGAVTLCMLWQAGHWYWVPFGH
jgi:hypothetical protein